MLYGQDRNQLRRFYLQAWQKRQTGQPMEPLEQMVSAIIEQHPEYQPALSDADKALGREYLPEDGETNPFLHLGLHIAIQEQLQADRPAGIRAAYQNLVQRLGDPHSAEHQMMDCLGEALWRAQRDGRPPDESAYLDCVRRQLLP